MNKYYFDGVIVVEGKSDVSYLSSFIDSRYFITNGYAVPINWSKSSRKAKTKYTYAEGTVIDGKDMSGKEIEVSDGRTWIEVQTNSQTLTIE